MGARILLFACLLVVTTFLAAASDQRSHLWTISENSEAYTDCDVMGRSRGVTDCALHCMEADRCNAFNFYGDNSTCALCDKSEMVMVARQQAGVTMGRKIYRDCGDVGKEKGDDFEGVHYIRPLRSPSEFLVLCAQGWTVIFDRIDGSLDFNRSWAEYRGGFGDLRSEFWLGNEWMHLLTNQDRYELVFDAARFDGNGTYNGHYSDFSIADENDIYRISVGGLIRGIWGLRDLDGDPFSTWDRDNNAGHNYTTNCAEHRLGGWWYKSCAGPSLTSFYPTNQSTCNNPNSPSLFDCMKTSVGPKTHVLLKSATLKIRKMN